MPLDPLIVKAISIGLGLMFLVAAWHKLADSAAFRIALIEYELLPGALVAPLSRVIPLAEILLGGSWLLASDVQSTTAIASATLLAVYALAIAVNIRRGRVHFDCGCGFGGKSDDEQYLSVGLIFRNLVLMGAALLTLLPAGTRDLRFGDYLTLIAALVAGALLFAAANQLLANRAAIDTWRKPV